MINLVDYVIVVTWEMGNHGFDHLVPSSVTISFLGSSVFLEKMLNIIATWIYVIYLEP